MSWSNFDKTGNCPEDLKVLLKLEKKYAPALDNYGQSCFVRSDFLKMKCVCGSHKFVEGGRGVMVFNTTFNNILVISCRSVLSVEETGVPGENHRPVASHWQTFSHFVVLSTPRNEQGSNSQL